MKNKTQFFLMLLSNIFPLYGLFYLGWTPFNTVFVFWTETVLIFIFSELKIVYRILQGQLSAIFVLLFLIPSIVPFIVIHLMLSGAMFATTSYSLQLVDLWRVISSTVSVVFISIAIMAVQYIYDFLIFIKEKMYEKPLSKFNNGGISVLYARIFSMQFTVIVGGLVAKTTGNLALGVSVLVLLQIIQNLWHFMKKNRVSGAALQN